MNDKLQLKETKTVTWIDSHCHLTDKQFDGEVAAIIERAHEAGVEQIVVVGDNLKSSREAIALAGDFQGLYATAGVHPHHAEEWSESAAQDLRALCDNGQIVALGEIGLDFFYDFAPRETQTEAFLAQAQIARETGLPLVMHCREAYAEFLDLIRRHDLAEIGGVMHCFSGSPREARELAEMGFFIGVGGTLTFKKNEAGREAVREVPIELLVLETDAPYLAPIPKRGKRNEPALMIHTAKRLAEELKMSEEDLAQILSENTARLFRTLTI